MNKLLYLFALLVFTKSIQIAVSSLDYKCMIVYSTQMEDHLKIDMKFPAINGEQEGQHYSIVLQNSETEEQQEFTIKEGTFRKEIQLAENILFKLCTKIILNRSGSANMQKYIEYKTAVKHLINSQTKIEVPKSLLKIHDLKQSYEALINLGHTLEGLQGIKNTTREHEQTLFSQQNEKVKKIQFINFIELAAIVVLGGYQYFSLKNIIENRHK